MTARVVSASFGVATVLWVWRMARKRGGPLAGITAAALLAGDVAGALRQQPLAVAGGAAACAFFAFYSCVLFLRCRVVRVRLTASEGRLLGVTALVLAILNWLYLVRCGV